jgi:TonB family protein
MPRDARFWRNVAIIAVAHLAIIIMLVRWNQQTAKASSQSIVWMSGEIAAVGSPARTETATDATPPPEISSSSPVEPPEPSPQTSAKSDIQLSTPTPAPTPVATPTPKRIVTPTPVPKAPVKPTARPTARPSPKKSAEPKATPKPSPKKSAPPVEQKKTTDEARKDSVKVAPANTESDEGHTKGSTETSGSARSSEFSWYGKMLHDRFHSEWIQPTTSVAVGAKMSALVRIRIERDGRISKFTLVRPSGNVVVDESVAAVAKRVTQVDPLPAGLAGGAYYEVNINFELNPEP